MDNTYEFEYYDDYEDDFSDDSTYSPVHSETFMQAAVMFDRTALRDKLSIISFYIAVFESFKSKVVDDIKSLFCIPEPSSTLGEIRFIKSDSYKKYILNTVIGKDRNGKDITGWKDPLKSTMLWLKNNQVISEEDFQTFIKLRKLRNDYVHKMATYIITSDIISIDDYRMLNILILLFKKIEIWFVKNSMNNQYMFSYELINEEIKDADINIPLISAFEMMAESLDLM